MISYFNYLKGPAHTYYLFHLHPVKAATLHFFPPRTESISAILYVCNIDGYQNNVCANADGECYWMACQQPEFENCLHFMMMRIRE